MKPANKNLVMLVAAVLGLFFLKEAYAQPFNEGPGRGGAGKIFEKLNLTPEQETKIREFQKSERQSAKAIHSDMEKKREALKVELDKPVSDQAKIKTLVAEMKDIHGKLIEQRVNGALKMKEILTPEQFAKFKDSLKQFEKKGRGRFGKNRPERDEPGEDRAPRMGGFKDF